MDMIISVILKIIHAVSLYMCKVETNSLFVYIVFVVGSECSQFQPCVIVVYRLLHLSFSL